MTEGLANHKNADPKRALRELEIRHKIAHIFHTAPNHEMYHRFLEVILAEMRSKAGVFGYLDENGNLVVPTMSRYSKEECQVAGRRDFFPRDQWGDSLWARVLREKRALYSNEPSRHLPQGHMPIHRNMAVPLVFRGEVIGLLHVANKETDYDEQDLQVATVIAEETAPILHARLQKERQEKARRQLEEKLMELNKELEQRVAERTAQLEASLRDLQAAEERLRLSNEQLAAQAESLRRLAVVLQDSNDAVTVQDLEGRILAWNRGAERVYGWTEREALGMNILNTIPPDRREEVATLMARVRAGEVVDSFETQRLTKDGRRLDVWLTVTRLVDNAGNLTGVATTERDITERKRTEAQLREANRQLAAANKELEAFSYSVSHDLRAPLRSINGFSRILQEDYAAKLNKNGRHHLDRIRASVQQMSNLIEALLMLSRLSRQQMRRTQVNLSALVSDVAQELREGHPERQVEFVIAPNVVCHGDPALLRIVMQNLIGNAWKFTGKKEKARIEFGILPGAGEEAHVYFVRDNGAGFDMRYANQLFGAFQRLHSPTEFEGTGIGLTTVQRIIHRHGGRVWAEGEVAKGATFYFTLPEERSF